jgi:hypothetical protein
MDPFLHRFQPRGGARGQDHMDAFAAEGFGNGGADPARGTGDEGETILKGLHGCGA